MTVEELRERLLEYDQTLPVMVNGYEDGYDYIAFTVTKAAPVKRQVWYSGIYENAATGTKILALERTQEET